VADVLVAKTMAAVAQCGLRRLVVAGGVGANRRLRERLGAAAARQKVGLYLPELQFCTDNGAMISLAGALRLKHGGGVAAAMATGAAGNAPAVSVRPRWPLAELAPPG